MLRGFLISGKNELFLYTKELIHSQARLDRERERTRQLSEELRLARCPDGERISAAVKEAAAKPPNMAQTNHNIPHR